jgi:hypothetical protein
VRAKPNVDSTDFGRRQIVGNDVRTTNPNWQWVHSVGIPVLVLVIILGGLLIPANLMLLTWILILVCLVLLTMLFGHGITGRFWLGWMVNEQFRMSLSRLQMALWTLVVLSGFLAAALANLAAGHIEEALDIAIPPELWATMGISTTSLVGSSLILTEKKKEKTNKDEALRGMVEFGLLAEDADPATATAAVEQRTSGQLQRNTNPSQARLYDLVSGEEVGNFSVLDLTRLQNLFFTLVLVGAYAATLGNLFAGAAISSGPAAPISSFPALDASIVALLGISHGGYLVGKAANKQPKGEGA